MKTMIFKVNEKIPRELDLIQDEEGLGNRTSTLTFLVKYYFLTKTKSLDHAVHMLDRVLERFDTEKLPSARTQLNDV